MVFKIQKSPTLKQRRRLKPLWRLTVHSVVLSKLKGSCYQHRLRALRSHASLRVSKTIAHADYLSLCRLNPKVQTYWASEWHEGHLDESHRQLKNHKASLNGRAAEDGTQLASLCQQLLRRNNYECWEARWTVHNFQPSQTQSSPCISGSSS